MGQCLAAYHTIHYAGRPPAFPPHYIRFFLTHPLTLSVPAA